MSPSSENLRDLIRAGAAERNRLHALGARLTSAASSLAAQYAASREFIDRLVAPGALEKLASGNTDALDYAVCFLEVYPLCPDSGFAMRDLARALRDTDIPENFAVRLRAAFLHIVTQPPRDEMKHLRRLALKVADSAFVAALDDIAQSRDIVAAENARALAEYIVKQSR